MKTYVKRIALLALLVGIPATALALTGPKNLSREARVKNFCFTYPDINNARVDGGGDITPGADGLLFRATLELDAGVGTISERASACNADGGACIFQPSVPTRIGYLAVEDSLGSNGTLACTGITISGTDDTGHARTECVSGCAHPGLSAVSETAAYTQAAFSKVEAVQMTGCTAFIGQGDDVRLFQSRYIGLQSRLNAATDVESVCLSDRSASGRLFCSRQQLVSAAITRSANGDYLDLLSSGMLGATPDDEDEVCIRVRPSWAGVD